jgi:hypothetical protein
LDPLARRAPRRACMRQSLQLGYSDASSSSCLKCVASSVGQPRVSRYSHTWTGHQRAVGSVAAVWAVGAVGAVGGSGRSSGVLARPRCCVCRSSAARQLGTRKRLCKPCVAQNRALLEGRAEQMGPERRRLAGSCAPFRGAHRPGEADAVGSGCCPAQLVYEHQRAVGGLRHDGGRLWGGARGPGRGRGTGGRSLGAQGWGEHDAASCGLPCGSRGDSVLPLGTEGCSAVPCSKSPVVASGMVMQCPFYPQGTNIQRATTPPTEVCEPSHVSDVQPHLPSRP